MKIFRVVFKQTMCKPKTVGHFSTLEKAHEYGAWYIKGILDYWQRSRKEKGYEDHEPVSVCNYEVKIVEVT